MLSNPLDLTSYRVDHGDLASCTLRTPASGHRTHGSFASCGGRRLRRPRPARRSAPEGPASGSAPLAPQPRRPLSTFGSRGCPAKGVPSVQAPRRRPLTSTGRATASQHRSHARNFPLGSTHAFLPAAGTGQCPGPPARTARDRAASGPAPRQSGGPGPPPSPQDVSWCGRAVTGPDRRIAHGLSSLCRPRFAVHTRPLRRPHQEAPDELRSPGGTGQVAPGGVVLALVRPHRHPLGPGP